MKKKLKKGFTLVELVIVIAVIAILSAVLIPTFGNVIQNANDSAAKSEVSNAITQYTTNQASHNLSADLPDGYIVLFKKEQTVSGNAAYASYTSDNISYVFSYNKGKLEMVTWSVKTAATDSANLVLTVKGEPVTLNVKGLTSVTADSWKADGTVVLDGTVITSGSGTSATHSLTGKVVLLAKVAQLTDKINIERKYHT